MAITVDVIQYIDSTGIPYKRHGREIALQYCPYCERPGEGDYSHFYFNQSKEQFICHHCGAKGNLYKFMADRGDISPITKAREIQYTRPKEDKKLIENTESFYDWYQKTRGINPEILEKYKVGHKKEKGKYTIVYQYFNENNVLINRKYRTQDKKMWTEKEAEHNFYGLQFIDFKKPYIHVCEGEDDCHALIQLGFDNVVSIPYGAGSYTPTMDKTVQQFEEIILLFDNDPKGQEGAYKFAEKAGFARCRNAILPFKDARECLLNGLERHQIANEIMDSDFFKHEEIIKPYDVRDDFMKYAIEGEKLTGRSIRIPGFNKIVGGIRLSELSVLIGYTGHGKSTFAYNFTRWAEEIGFKCMIMSFENHLFKVINKLIEIYTGESIKDFDEIQKKYILCQTPEWIEKEFDRLNDREIYFLNKGHVKDGYYDIERMGQVIEYAVKFYNVNVFVIDHLHYFLKISNAKNPVLVIDEAVRQIKQWTNKFKIHILLIVHPHMKSENNEGLPPKLGLNSVKSAISISQEPDNVWAIYRKEKDNQYFALLDILKNREMGRLGSIEFSVLDNLNTYMKMFENV